MIKLAPLLVDKPWGVKRLPPPFLSPANRRVGEIWFPSTEGGKANSLLAKFLFTSEKLSIQVHPDDEQARARGHATGKEECWYILDAQPGARLAIGTIRPLDPAELHEAVQTGAIEELLQWHPAEPAMLFHIPPGTIHAIGPGISLLEVQQASDITYRLYDYGRPRELHLADGAAVADARPFPSSQQTRVDRETSAILLDANLFKIAQLTDDNCELTIDPGEDMLVLPIAGMMMAEGKEARVGDCLLVRRDARLELGPRSRALLAWHK